MKKAKTNSHVVRNTFLYSMLVVGIIFSALVTPWEELQTSLVDSANTSQEDILNSLQSINLTLRGMQQQDLMNKQVLIQDANGTKSFTVQENTCENGVKLIVQLNEIGRSQTGSIQLSGIAPKKSRSMYGAVVTVDDDMPIQIRHLPNSMMLDNDTVFLQYKISTGNYADRVEYSIECY